MAEPTVGASSEAIRVGHSRIGIWSFILATIADACILAMVVALRYLESLRPGTMAEEFGPAFVVGALTFLCMLVNLAAFILAIIGLSQKTKKRTFAAIGLGFSLAPVLYLFVASG